MSKVRCIAAAIATLTFATCVADRALADTLNEKLNKISRAIARIKVVGDVCGERFVIDRIELNDIMGRLLSRGLKQFDEPVLSSRVSDMRLEFISNIKTDGILVWCVEQRGMYKGTGAPEFIGERIR